MTPKPKWYAFRTAPMHVVSEDREFAVVEVLKRRGFTAHVPAEVKVYRRHRERRGVPRKYPILTGYCLMAFDGEPPWHDIFKLNVIKSVVGFGGHPAEIPHDQIEKIFRLASENVPTRNLNKGFKAGDKVRAKYGGFAEADMKVEAVIGEKVRILLGLFGSEYVVEMPLAQLEAAQ